MSTSAKPSDASLPAAPTRQWLRDRLAQAGLRATRQRLLILESLVVAKGHPTAEQVHRQVLRHDATLSLGTVYKALDSFVTTGLSKRVPTAEGACRRYDADCSTHHHLYCSDTQEIIDYCDPQLDALIREFLEARGFQNFRPRSFSLHITGERADLANEPQ
ncbi:ferric uptake regulator, Fur family [Hymenobacter roseosalivarius DSM 11622]|uniref:Ferric uptake regulator, Fur family n=1 Tax=Hymenobacter roseosalivarius DSM 11622 TaxID=645990 RepID=A0A1W1W3U0_9BACT|nr:Fur family transcriptional regulator [Hymenobacter roseosalivarius]SMC00295.1 ferric uptake regulator, Fur family [Hymenobacter roseosalivarius DSM 11622]